MLSIDSSCCRATHGPRKFRSDSKEVGRTCFYSAGRHRYTGQPVFGRSSRPRSDSLLPSRHRRRRRLYRRRDRRLAAVPAPRARDWGRSLPAGSEAPRPGRRGGRVSPRGGGQRRRAICQVPLAAARLSTQFSYDEYLHSHTDDGQTRSTDRCPPVFSRSTLLTAAESPSFI